jgi:hypothetical protein
MFVSIEPPDQLRVLNATVGARRFVDTSETAPFEDRLNLHEYRYRGDGTLRRSGGRLRPLPSGGRSAEQTLDHRSAVR